MEQSENKTKLVYSAICKVQEELAKTGIEKNRRNNQGSGYNFRGIDDVYNALSPLLAKHNLCIMPRILRRELIERKSSSGGNLYFVTVKAAFDFISAFDSSCHTVITYGEAMDSGDKATNKAMSAAYKYACFQTFAIPTEGDNDSENSDVTLSDHLIEHINKINACTSAEEVVKTFQEAYKSVGNDTNAQKILIKVKNTNKDKFK
jgi:hypothetical protein